MPAGTAPIPIADGMVVPDDGQQRLLADGELVLDDARAQPPPADSDVGPQEFPGEDEFANQWAATCGTGGVLPPDDEHGGKSK